MVERKISIDQLRDVAFAQAVSAQSAVAQFGGIYEHSDWVPSSCNFAGQNSVGELAEKFHAIVEASGQAKQLVLLRAHPDLAGKLALAGELTQESTSEQSAIGLDQCSAQEFEAFQRLNADYLEKFGFPFILCVRRYAARPDFSRQGILAIMSARLDNDRDTEFTTALNEVHDIALHRLYDMRKTS